jgi:hypothetical protein
MTYQKWLEKYHPGADPKDSDLDEIRKSGYVRAIVHYKDNCVWLWTKTCAYDRCCDWGKCVPAFWEMLRTLTGKGWQLSGHSDSPSYFNLRKSKAKKVEVIG